MPRDTYRSAPALAVASIALLAGCASTPAAEPTPTQAGPVEYGSVEDLRDAFIAAGGDCPDWQQDNVVDLSAESGSCSDSVVLSTYTSVEDRDAVVDSGKAIADLIGMHLLVGPN